ncbi:MAG: MFS transporter [Rhodobacteraceae bacterium]|nr:MFS transporter [Paracoccaceae bacterium]
MAEVSQKKRIWGWMFFDWASQPYNTLVLTFVFGPYFAQIVSNHLIAGGMAEGAAKAQAQEYWGWGLTIIGIFIAVLAPVLGAFADNSGRRMPWIWLFSIMYVVGAFGLWQAAPPSFSIFWVLVFFGIGMVGMEFATIFTNAMLPDLGTKEQIGRISGSGWAFGYWGGVLALIIMLLFLAENENGVTLIGIKPILGLDAAMREGTRSVGPLTGLWYAVFMIPFFLWVREVRRPPLQSGFGVSLAVKELMITIRKLPATSSLFAYLASSMFYRDALNGMFTFGGIYAYGVLGWSVVDVGVFGILAAITGAIFAWVGGIFDQKLGPKPVIFTGIFTLLLVCISVVLISRDSVFGITVGSSSKLPDIAFYVCGCLIGAAGGALQSASRTMLVRQANPARMTEAFGLYALAGKATSFLAPATIAMTTSLTGSQRLGVTPLILLFAFGLFLLFWVTPDRQTAEA